jgi:predicted  nucleic acid-binding Zn-ribbon protein
MTKQIESNKSQPGKKNGHKPEPAVNPERSDEFTAVAELSAGLLKANGNGKMESQAVQLGTSRIYTIQRQAAAMRIGQAQGNHHLQRLFMQSRVPVSPTVIQRHDDEDEADVEIQRQPTASPSPQAPAPAQPAAVKDPTTDDAFVNQTIDSFQSEVLKAQIGPTMRNRRNFLVGMQQYLGTLDDVINHFKKIRAVQNVPALKDAHLHETAATRIEMVAEKLGPDLMPGTDVALGLRNRYHPHMRQPRGLMAHPCGYAIDFRAVANPHITDSRLVKLIAMRTGGAGAMKLGNYWSIIKRMGEQTAKGGIDPNSPLGKEAATFQAKLEEQFKRVSEASKNFQTELGGTRAELLAAHKGLQQFDHKLSENGKQIKNKQREISKLRKNPKKAGKTKEDFDKAIAKLNQEKADLEKEAQTLKEQKQQTKDKIRPELPRLFRPWLDQINQEMQNIEAQVKKVLPAGDTSKLPSQKELANQSKAIRNQLRNVLKKKKKAESAIKKLKRQIDKEKRLIPASQKRMDDWGKDITKTQIGMSGAQGRVPTAARWKRAEAKIANLMARKSAERQKITAREASIAQKGQEVDKEQAVLTEQGTAETAAQQTLHNIEQQKKLLPQTAEYKTLQSLKDSLTKDTDFVFEGKKAYSNPAVAQLLEKGYFNPDPARQPGEKFNSRKHGFDLAFFKAMTEHGFELGASWTPGNVDPMHLQLVEGVQSIRNVRKTPSSKATSKAGSPAATTPAAKSGQPKQQVQPKLTSAALQRNSLQAGTTLIQRQPKTNVQFQPGWHDASDASWNKGEVQIGSIKRIPIDGLKHGNQQAYEDTSARGSTKVSASGKAIVLQHESFKNNPQQPAKVLLHLHGFGAGYRQLDSRQELESQLADLRRERDGYKKEKAAAVKIGDRAKVKEMQGKLNQIRPKIISLSGRIKHWKLDFAGVLQPGQVRDIELYRMEQQLNALQKPQTMVILPQGTSKSKFGTIGAQPTQYVDEVMGKLKITKYKLALSGHSGGGHTVRQILEGKEANKINEIVLFDANWYKEFSTAEAWLNKQIKADAQAVSRMSTISEIDAYFSTRPIFRAYFSPNYAGRYKAIQRITKTLRFKKIHALTPGTRSGKQPHPLQDHIRRKLVHHYQVIGPIKAGAIEDAWHDKVISGQSDPTKPGILYEALSAF